MMSNEEEDQKFLNNCIKLAARMASFIKSKRGDCLYTVKIKGKGKGFYWSLSDKAFLWIDKGSDFYWVNKVKKDDRDRLCLFTPHTFGLGVLIMVPEDEIQWIGLN